MTIQQTIDIPASRKVHFDVVLPQDIPYGRADVILDFKPAAIPNGGTGEYPVMDDELARLVAEAGRRAERERTDPVYRQQVMDRFKRAQEGGPIFGGISAEDFKKECNDEWENRF
jgi:hypothetical protein